MTPRRLLPHTLALACLAVVGCSSAADDDATATGSESALATSDALPAPAVTRWESYVARVTAEAPLQEGCAPTRVSPPQGVRAKGVVALFHGFTACPQQFVDVAADLAASGFEVLLPLLPGNGRVPRVVEGTKRVDDVSGLPGGKGGRVSRNCFTRSISSLRADRRAQRDDQLESPRRRRNPG